MDDKGITSPFNGDFNISRAKMPPLLNISRIEEQPVSEVGVHFNDRPNYTIEAGDSKHYGLGFFEYCRQKYGCTVGGVFTITLPMVCEAIMYYGKTLWNDTSKEHPSIIPFRRALAGEEVRVKIHHKSDR